MADVPTRGINGQRAGDVTDAHRASWNDLAAAPDAVTRGGSRRTGKWHHKHAEL